MKSPSRAPARRSPKRCVLGLDFGTLSGRALLVDADTGEELASAVHAYANGVIETALPGSKKRLPLDTALQDPADYLKVLSNAVPNVLQKARVRPEQVIGLGTDFTSCTMLPVTADGTPLCARAKWRSNPHAWVKLWKHHAAQPEANLINETGRKRGELFLETYGGKYSSEWFFSKLLETVRAAPEVYDASDRFLEAGDWIVWQLCGQERRSLSAAGFKGMWIYPDGQGGWTYPSPAFFKALHPKLENVVQEKLAARLYPLGQLAGGLIPSMAKLMGLRPGLPVATANIDAHAAVPACGVTTPGKLVMIMGTSTCHLLIAESKAEVEGMCGVVKDGVVPGYWGYEAGQSGVGDLFAWYVDNAVPAPLQAEAVRAKLGLHELLERQAASLQPGESGLLALDWWNGNRSVLVDADLSGLLVGATMATKPHEIYRALIESTAFGTRKIIEAFAGKGVAIHALHACGGLAQKNALLVQIYSDVTGMPIRVAGSEQASALGAAMHAAVAAGVYPDIHTAARRMARLRDQVFKPDLKAKAIYDVLYEQYSKLHDFFGRDPSGTMKVLKRLKIEARAKP